MTTQFFTDDGLEVPSVTTEQMIEVDRVAIEETGPNLFQMMENAGRMLAMQVIECLGEDWQQGKIVVLAGGGGNGGGGICAARHLANHGANVRLCLSSPDHLKEVTAWQRHVFQSTDGEEIKLSALLTTDEPVDLIVDALIGYSLRDAPRGKALDLIKWANATNAPILSLDTPSGVDSTTGETPGDYIHAQWTMTLALPKTGLLPGKTGKLVLADIGIPKGTYAWETLQLNYRAPFGGCDRIPLTVMAAS